MKTIPILGILTLLLFVNASAQSGRRTQTAPSTTTPVVTSDVQETQDVTKSKQQETAGYSESVPNSSRVLLSRPSKALKKEAKKEAKTEAKKDSQTPAPDNAQRNPNSDEDTIKVETNLVTIPVSVSDRNGFYISDLSQSNFKVFEDGVEQEVAYFGTSEKPFTVVLLIDVSPSTSYKIEEIQDAAAAFVQQLKPQDQVMVIEFDSSVHVLTEVTSDRDKINKAIRKTGFGDGTSLYDAVAFSIRKRLDKVEGRKAIVLFTDGVDTTSFGANFDSTIRDAEESDSVIFPIYYNTFLNNAGIGGGGGVMSTPPILGMPGGGTIGNRPRGSTSADYTRGRTYLTELADATGGKLFRAESTPGGLTTAFESIADELRRQYTIGYYPSKTGEAGERRQIKVRINRPKLIIRTRDSYVVGGGTAN